LSASPLERPALLEGRWLAGDHSQAIAALGPISCLEGDPSTLAGLPDWLTWHARRYPEGGAIGYLCYELARAFERVPLWPDGRLPEFSFAYYPRLERIRKNREWAPACPPDSGDAEIVAGFDRAQFLADVERIREYIAAGDIYQANLTQQFIARLHGQTPESLYVYLAKSSAPMRAFLNTPHAAIISNSPERFFHLRGNRILTSPIKGTILRRGDPVEDSRLRAMLLASPKDRAENVMIVDLLRNDLGRICYYDTIRTRLYEVETLPHLFHLVSHVEGKLRPELGPLEVLRALFPCGSVTGAPKVRAMEILAELESSPRGVAMGAVGIILGAPGSRRFEMDFNVAIRTMIVRDGLATLRVGCGIVYDSNPESEYAEMLLKARPLLASLGLQTQSERRQPEVVATER